MRIPGALLLANAMMIGSAQASSFVVVAPPKDTVSASFVVLGAALPKPVSEAAVSAPQDKRGSEDFVRPAFPFNQVATTKVTRISTSIVAFDTPVPNVAYENVAAIMPSAAMRKPVRMNTPMVMRGGIIGDAFARASTGVAPVVQVSEKTTVKSGQDKPVARKDGSSPSPEDPVKIILAPPPPNMPKLRGVE